MIRLLRNLAFIVVLAAVSLAASYLEPIKDSAAYQQYKLKPKSELAKLIFLMDRYRDTDYKIVYDGSEYTAQKAMPHIKRYMAKHYEKDEDAKKWVRIHSYRSKTAGDVIYILHPDGSKEEARQVLLAELDALEQVKD